MRHRTRGILGVGFSYGWSVIGVGVVYIFYTFYGGMRAVTLTDFVQGLLMISVVVLCGGFALGANSGAATLYDLAITLRPQWEGTEAFPLASYIGAFVIWATVNAVLPHTVMRIFAAKNERQGRASLAIGLGLYVLTAVVTTVFVVAAVVVLQGGEDLEAPDSTFLIFLAQQTPTWLAGLAFAGIFAAVMSSVSAMLLALGGAFAYDQAHLDDVADLRADPRVTISGVGAAGSGMSAEDVVEGYVEPTAVDKLVRDYVLKERRDGNVRFRIGQVRQIGKAAIAAELADWGRVRELREADRLIRELLSKVP
ncbi:hypothetical protein [Leucobacter sp. NPDC077196]|uniref:sodium:solute symporter family transporter n=1 Tax=Leucobacter sp. NPDC077196 TaxID=3154959 RepID=UPI0034293ADB